jgi:hypothetical protein
VYSRPKEKGIDYKVSKLSDIQSIIIPFFKKYPLQGCKALDYNDFCGILELMTIKAHLTPEGLKKIRACRLRGLRGLRGLRLQIKMRMNTGRSNQ